MSVGRTLFAATLAGMLALTVSPASSQTLRYANQGDLKSLDPYSLNEFTTHAHLGHVYQGLTARDKDLKIIPALAESWETPEPTRWRFHLRKGVKFHNGDPFTADDVLFSADRVRNKSSNMQTRLAARRQGRQGRRLHGRFRPALAQSHPAFRWDVWYIMDKKWAEENNAVEPTPVPRPPRATPRCTRTVPAPSSSRAISPA